MPGERNHFTRFLADLNSPTLARVAEAMWDELALAGVAGSLLKPEERLRQVIAEERAAYQKRPRVQQLTLAPELERPEQQPLDFSDVTDDRFWNLAEERILTVLREYSESVEDGDATTRRLFAADSAQGFRFVDVLRQRYDVVLMNPPFGEGSSSAKLSTEKTYPCSKSDLFAAFVDRGLNLSAYNGRLGAITSRAGFFLTSFKEWRQNVILATAHMDAVADLGYGVLDKAMVETAAYILQLMQSPVVSHVRNSVENSSDDLPQKASLFLRLIGDEDKDKRLHLALENSHVGYYDAIIYAVYQDTFLPLPGSPFAYWVSNRIRCLFVEHPPLEGDIAEVCQGLATADDSRFLRATWECTGSTDTLGSRWLPFVKGGEFSPYYSDVHLAVNWKEEGEELRSFSGSFIRNESRYGQPGLTYPRRTQRGFNVRVMPQGCVFADKGPAIVSLKGSTLPYLLGLLNSSVAQMMLSMQVAFGSYEVGAVQHIPYALPCSRLALEIGDRAVSCHLLRRDGDRADETSHVYTALALLLTSGNTFAVRIDGVPRKIAPLPGQAAGAGARVTR